jgi:hypothetical protein
MLKSPLPASKCLPGDLDVLPLDPHSTGNSTIISTIPVEPPSDTGSPCEMAIGTLLFQLGKD